MEVVWDRNDQESCKSFHTCLAVPSPSGRRTDHGSMARGLAYARTKMYTPALHMKKKKKLGQINFRKLTERNSIIGRNGDGGIPLAKANHTLARAVHPKRRKLYISSEITSRKKNM